MKRLFKILVNVIIFLLLIFVFYYLVGIIVDLSWFGEYRYRNGNTVDQVVIVISGLLSWSVTKKISRRIFKG